MIHLPNEIIINIYNYANEESKYNMLYIFKWLRNLQLKCGNGVTCNNKAKYIFKFKLVSNHKECCNLNNKEILKFTTIVCSLKCKNTLIIKCSRLNYLIRYLVYFGNMSFSSDNCNNQYYKAIEKNNRISIEYYLSGEKSNQKFCDKFYVQGIRL
jgi:hypothetical protein